METVTALKPKLEIYEDFEAACEAVLKVILVIWNSCQKVSTQYEWFVTGRGGIHSSAEGEGAQVNADRDREHGQR